MKLLYTLIILFFCGLLSAQTSDPSAVFSKYEVISANPDQLITASKNSANGIASVVFDRWQLQLEIVDLYADQIRSNNEKAIDQTPRAELPTPTRGYTNKGGRVSLTFAKDFIYGFVEEEGKTFFIEPLWYYDASAAKGEFIVYASSDVIDNGPKTCGYNETLHKGKELEPGSREKVTGLCYEVEYGICADYSMFDKYGSVANVEAQVVGVTNNVNTNYNDEFDDELVFFITGIHTITTMGGDPWSASTDSDILLESFRVWAIANLDAAPLNIAHDVASLWSDRDFDGTTIGLAYRPGACNTNFKYNILQDFNNNADLLRVLTAHELGHNFSATHDAMANTFIMSSSVSNVNIWSANSISQVEAYYNSQSCLAICAGSTPQVNFDEASSSTGEYGGSGTTGTCNEPFIDITRTLSLTLPPAANAIVDVAIDPTSSAINLFDFELITTSVTFTPAGSLSQDITIRIYDDVIEELAETIVLNITSSSTDIVVGFVDQHTVTITSSGDVVGNDCCSDGGEITYGAFQFSAPLIFRGNSEDARTRTLYTAAQLTAAGLTAGNINQLSLFIFAKTSTAAFEDFRIGMLQVADTDLAGAPWYATDQVFSGDVTTVVSSWNNFPFNNLFNWDGVSSIYIDYCFNNSSAVGTDNIIGSDAGTTGGRFADFFVANGEDVCGQSPSSFSFFNDLQPHIKLNQVTGSMIETTLNSTSGGQISAGNTAHFYSATNELVCSINNLGTTDMDCVDVTVNTAGNGQPNLPFGSSQYSDKTIQVDAGTDAFYELTLYYTDTELAIWGVTATDLNIIQSSSPIAASSTTNSSIHTTLERVENIGSGDGDSYKTTVSGNGYFALTNSSLNRLESKLDQADFIIEEFGKGILLTSSLGNQYLVTADLAGNLTATLDVVATATQNFDNCDLILPLAGKGIVLNGDTATPTLINVDNDGAIVTTVLGAVPATIASLETGNVGFSAAGTGVVFKNSENECWRLTVENNGGLLMVPVGCN